MQEDHPIAAAGLSTRLAVCPDDKAIKKVRPTLPRAARGLQRTWAEVERRRVETALRQIEERQAFLLELSDSLRQLQDSGAIELEAARMLGEHLDVAAVCFGHLLEDRVEVVCESS